MNRYDDSLDPRIRNALDQVKSFPPRNPQVAARGRARFLAQANSLRSPVPARSFWRQIGWTNLFPQKARFRMGTLAAVLLALGLVFGGSGAAVYAAQDALPDDLLYPLKILTEDVRVSLAGDAETRANLLLDFADRRTMEMAAQSAQGGAPTDPVIARQQEQIENALRIAADLDDENMNRILTRAQAHLAQQLRVTEQMQNQSAQAAPIWARVQEMLATQHALAQMGLENQTEFRERLRERNRVPPLPPRTPFFRSTLPITATLRARPTNHPSLPLPTRLVTLTLQPRQTRVPPMLTIPARPTDWERPTRRWLPPVPLPDRTPLAPPPGRTPAISPRAAPSPGSRMP